MNNLKANEIFKSEVLDNISDVIREANHMEINGWCKNRMEYIGQKVFAAYIVTICYNDDANEYLHKVMLDIMDEIKYKMFIISDMRKTCAPNSYKVIHSLYDIIKEWYFNN